MSNKSVYVFIPAYNEEENIEEVINGLKKLKMNIKTYVIDDGSTDRTAEKARKAGATVIKHPVNLGGGAAIRTAFTIALLNDAEYIVTLDGDGQHDPDELPMIITEMRNGTDLIIGSRFLKEQKQEMLSYRLLGIKFFSWLVSKMMRIKITDATSGYRAYKTETVRKILFKLKENQYYGLEIVVKMAKNGVDIKEVPITSKTRVKGRSKKGALSYGYNLMRVVIRNLT